jgi:hypothetical protein
MSRLSKVEILGGGPAGLYTAILLRRLMPDVHVRLTEQNAVGATFGFGVVFSDQALDFLKADDAEFHDLVTPHMERWQNMTLNLPRDRIVLDGVGFSAIGRLELNEILRKYAESLGAEMRFSHHVASLDELQADVVVGADGLNSLVRNALEDEFQPTIDHFNNHFAWFGTTRPFDTLTQSFVKTRHGAFNAHHYRFAPDRSTFIVECDDPTYRAYGFDAMSEEGSVQLCQDIFADVLEGAPLVTNKSMWRSFRGCGATSGSPAGMYCWAMPCTPHIFRSAQAHALPWRMRSRWSGHSLAMMTWMKLLRPTSQSASPLPGRSSMQRTRLRPGTIHLQARWIWRRSILRSTT